MACIARMACEALGLPWAAVCGELNGGGFLRREYEGLFGYPAVFVTEVCGFAREQGLWPHDVRIQR